MHSTITVLSRYKSVQVMLLGLIAFVAHLLVLRFIFPGYYSPLYPYHSDFYISVALYHSPEDFFQYRYLGYSRPIGIFFLKYIGSLGIHGAMLFTIGNVFLNAVLSALLIQRIFQLRFNLAFLVCFAVYAYLLFSQPYFYTFYTQDGFAHLSYFFLLIGAILYRKISKKSIPIASSVLFILSLIAFLCKETYALAAGFLTLVYFVTTYKKIRLIEALAPMISVTLAIFIMVVFNLLIKSLFLNFDSPDTSDPYYINASLRSLAFQFRDYVRDGFNWITLGIVAANFMLGVKLFLTGRKVAAAVVLGTLGAALLSLLPNCFIPNHYHGGYSFNGSYLFYLPIVLLPAFARTNLQKIFAALYVVACLINPVFSKPEFAKQGWILDQEQTQRNLLRSLDPLMNQLQQEDKQTVLVTGLNMPFYPFHHPNALKYYKHSANATYDVVVYEDNREAARENGVAFLRDTAVVNNNYSQIWMFTAQGKLLKKLILTPDSNKILSRKEIWNLVVHIDSTKLISLETVLKAR